MSKQLKQVQSRLRQEASALAATAHRKFVPGEQHIYGVRMPVLNQLAKECSAGGFRLVQELWGAGAFEEKILAIKVLERIAKKDPDQSLQLVRHFAKGIDNWAVCDALGMQALKQLVKTHRQEIFSLAENYNQSPDPWRRRLSLVLVEWYTREKEWHPRIRKLVRALANDKEYYVKKAVVWIDKNFEKGK